ncbi:hypothetical protein CIHG_01130 [Coccidioides immitis H538.4]|uniref:Uncharacterized protein n=2 Tax=Coccidioides immitis TaxID=5501 RepID=A0A0J8U8G2_COCIT|nr:hypothetical protein CIRG_03525 [Coccidioides immitis RMSCC 2394]KMU83348.1 hypothetical protein CIHG_01130 [Coccidioides immitis H538.4]
MGLETDWRESLKNNTGSPLHPISEFPHAAWSLPASPFRHGALGGRAAPVRAPKRLHKVPSLLLLALLQPPPRPFVPSTFLAPSPRSLAFSLHVRFYPRARPPTHYATPPPPPSFLSLTSQSRSVSMAIHMWRCIMAPFAENSKPCHTLPCFYMASITMDKTFLLLPAIFSLHFSAEAEESDRQQPSSRRGTPQSSQSSRRHREKYPVDQEDSRQLKKSILAILKGLDTSTSPTSTFQPSAGE